MVEDRVKLETKARRERINPVLLALVAGITLIFLALYHKFIFADYLYAYLDSGRDTVDQYIPRELYEINNFWNGATNQYSLLFGLGADYVFPWYKYFNPVNLPLLLIGRTNLAAALIISTYLKYLFIGLFAFLFFRRLIGSEKIAAICSLLWTYSSYNVLWGQHYAFLTSMLGFTIFMLGLQMILDGDKKWYLATIAFFVLVTTGYSFFYQACIFAVIYGAVYLIIRKQHFKECFKRLAAFILCTIVSVGIAAEYIAVSAEGFLTSSRMENVVSISLKGFYPIKNIVAIFARFFSNDTFGVAGRSAYPGNYYEIATISVGALAVLSFFWLIQTKYRKRVLAITAASILCLCLPLVSHILLFKATTQRWTFIICLLEIVMIGFALKDLYNKLQDNASGNDVRKKLIRTFVFSNMFLILSVVAFLVLKGRGFRVSKWTLIIVTCCYIMYNTAALLAYYIEKRGNFKAKKVVYALFFMCCMVEIFVMNYRSINSQSIVRGHAWDNSIYNDGTIEIVDEIKAYDDALYRINKTYDSKFYNDQMMQNYYGVGSYYSLNSQNLINAYAMLGNEVYENTDTLTGTNYIRFPGSEIADNEILAVKYVISNEEVLSDVFYEKILEEGDKTLYLNKFWNGFGKIYTDVTERDVIIPLDYQEKKAVIVNAAIMTGADALEVNLPIKDFDADYTYSEKRMRAALSALNENGSVDLKQDANIFYGVVRNESEDRGILCIPLIYEKHWNATIDGTDAKIYKINGGLLGLVIEPGEHNLEITYKNNTALIGRIVGIIFTIAYLSALFIFTRKRRVQ
ncbi:MAG: YfhO family protein [Firmicutes bacterium]|nr:YfhO family protein [Bacillota bacterium]